MEYYVSMQEEELKIAIILFGVRQLDDVIKIEDDYVLDEEVIDTMIKKGFFEGESNNRNWNKFVRFVLNSVINAEYVLFTKKPDGSLCNLYFDTDNIILLTKNEGETNYTFYYVPFIPKAVGGVAKFYEYLECYNANNENSSINSINVEEELCSAKDVMRALKDNKTISNNAKEVLQVKAMYNDKCFLFSIITEESNELILHTIKEKQIRSSKVTFYNWLQRLTQDIAYIHGKSAIKEDDNEKY